METAKLMILDVGHGNCAIVMASEGVVLIDCPPGVELLDTLDQLNITKISHVLISHADQDHIAGLPNLLLKENIQIGKIHLNPDAVKKTKIWEAVRRSLTMARRISNVNVEPQLTTTTQLNAGQLNIQVLAPVPELALTGVGGQDLLTGKKVTANAMSAVISVGYGARRSILLMGDLDQIGWDHLMEEGEALKAEVLVFPHHGGKPGAGVDGKTFAQTLCEAVQPKLVIFSIDRTLHKNPNQNIVQGVLSVVPKTHIMCTQLSVKCADSLPLSKPGHLVDLPAKGFSGKKCCAGTIVIEINQSASTYTPTLDAHKDFVAQYPKSLCQDFP
jgi:competence protein ComEC